MTLKVLKYNKNHYPAGSSKGGQFAPSKGRKPVESFFNNEPMQGIDHYNEVGFKSKEKLVPMKIDDFLKLAYPVTEGGDPGKNKGIKEMVDRGETFGIPFLEIRRSSDTPEIAEVVGHEGRHRGMYLKSLGYDTMPVKLRSDIRWSEQSDKSKFDYVDVWPKKLSSESVRLPNGEYKSLHILEFPVSREDATTSYKDLAKKPTVTKRNPNHYPAGSSKGGQFAPSKGNGGAKVTPPKSSAADTLSDYPITPDIAYDHPGESPEKLAEMSAMFAIKCDGEYTIPDITANITGPTGQARKNAEAMGFDLNQVWVHGSMSDIEEFIVNGEKVNGDSFWGKGAYFSSSPEDSSANYANREGPDFSNTVQNAAEIRFYQRHPDLNWDADLIEKYRQEIIRERTDSMGVVYPVYLAMKKPLKEDGGQFEISESRTSALARKVASVSKELGLSERTADEMKFYFTTAINRDHNDYDLLLNFRDSLSAETLIDDNVTAPEFTRHLAMKFGYDGVIMDAKRQFPHMPHMPQGTKHAIIWKPNQIRSVFAKFNLEDRNSANILKVDLKEVFKSNPNHYPAGAPGGKGGQFAPTHNKGKTVTGYHWSHQEALTETDPAKYGTGIKGAEASRLARQPDIKDRTYFYTTPTMREPGLGIHQYSTELTHMYDTAADEEGYKAIAKEKATPKPPFYGFDQVEYTNTLERLIKQGGYRGYLSSTMGGTAVSFYPAKVKKVIKKSNPNHYPAGSSKGGQFAPSKGKGGSVKGGFKPEAYASNVSSSPEYAHGYSLAKKACVDHGKATGKELMVVIDHKGGLAFTKAGTYNGVDFDDAMVEQFDNPDNRYTIVHNHPSNSSFSQLDIHSLLTYPGVEKIVAVAQDTGLEYVAFKEKKILVKDTEYSMKGHTPKSIMTHVKQTLLETTDTAFTRAIPSLSEIVDNKTGCAALNLWHQHTMMKLSAEVLGFTYTISDPKLFDRISRSYLDSNLTELAEKKARSALKKRLNYAY